MTNELLAEISLLKEKLAIAEKERDAAIEEIPRSCDNCKYDNCVVGIGSSCVGCDSNYSHWKWRGIQPSKEENK